jgi:hypothetical protein
MLFSLRSICLSSASIVASPLLDEPVTSLPPGADRADPVVTPAAGRPEELAMPALLVPDAGGAASFEEFPAPLGSLPELFRPPALAGPDGTPLTPAVPAPAEPALGEPAALPLPADGPLALPLLAPPALCANETTGPARIAIAMMDAVTDTLFIWKSPFAIKPHNALLVPRRNNFRERRLSRHRVRARRRPGRA